MMVRETRRPRRLSGASRRIRDRIHRRRLPQAAPGHHRIVRNRRSMRYRGAFGATINGGPVDDGSPLKPPRLTLSPGLGAALLMTALIVGTGMVWAQAINTFSGAGHMAVSRESHTATLLLDGRVLIAGGYS